MVLAIPAVASATSPAPTIEGTYATSGTYTNDYPPDTSSSSSEISLQSNILGASPGSSAEICIALPNRSGRWCDTSTYWWQNWWVTEFPVAAQGAGELYYTVFAHSGPAGSSDSTTAVRSGWATIATQSTLG